MKRIQDYEDSAASRPDASVRVDSVAAPRSSDIAEKARKILAGFDFQKANMHLGGLFSLADKAAAEAAEAQTEQAQINAPKQTLDQKRRNVLLNEILASGMQYFIIPVKSYPNFGCWKCLDEAGPQTYKTAPYVRNRDGKHYLVVIDGNGFETEYEIDFCPYCGKILCSDRLQRI